MSSFAPMVHRPSLGPTTKVPTSRARPRRLLDTTEVAGSDAALARGAVSLGGTNDALEREAERIASLVTVRSGQALLGAAEGQPPFNCATSMAMAASERMPSEVTRDDTPPSGEAPEGFGLALAGERQAGGSPLPIESRRMMESRLGRNFSQVNIHRNARASLLAERIDARAFTVGSDIFFNRGAFQPENHAGQRLLAHELVHTLQQGNSALRGGGVHVQRSLKFDKHAAEATTSIVDEDQKVTQSNPVFEEFVAGLREFLGIEVGADPRTYQIHTINPPDTFQAPVEKGADRIEAKIRARFARPIQVQSAEGGMETVDAEMAVGIWKAVRLRVREYIRRDVHVVASQNVGLDSPMGEIGGEIHVKPEWLANSYIRKASGWSQFWMLLHELVHLGGKPYKHRRTSNNAQAPTMKETREITLMGTKSTEEVTEIGSIEFELNVIRIGLGLPVRTNYAELPPGVSKKSKMRALDPMGLYFADTPGPDRKEYVGAILMEPGVAAERDQYSTSVFMDKGYDAVAADKAKRLAEVHEREVFSSEWHERLARIDEAAIFAEGTAKQEYTLALVALGDHMQGWFKGASESGMLTSTVEPAGASSEVEFTIRWTILSGNVGVKVWRFDLKGDIPTRIKNGLAVKLRSRSTSPMLELRLPAFTQEGPPKRQRRGG